MSLHRHPDSAGTAEVPTPRWSLAADWARVLAMVAVVAGHAAVAYSPHAPWTLRWAVRQPGPAWLDGVVLLTLVGAMPIFSVLAGVFAARSCERAGPARFLGSRVRRLGVPLALGILVVLPLTYPLWLRGWVQRGAAKPLGILQGEFKPGWEASLWGLGHLWYLQYLLVLCALYALWVARRSPPSPSAATELGGDRRGTRIIWTLPLALALAWWRPPSFTDFVNAFVPDAAKLALHGVYFAAGTLIAPRLARFAASPPRVARVWPVLLAGALGAAGLAWFFGDEPPTSRPLALAAAAAGFFITWGVLLGTLNIPRDFLSRTRARLARISLGVYVIHLPIVVGLQVLLFPFAWPPTMKVAIVFSGALLASIALCAAWAKVARGRRH